MKNEYFVLKVRIEAITLAMASLAKRGRKLPEDQRPALREVYARKAKQLEAARTQLQVLERDRERHKSIAKALA